MRKIFVCALFCLLSSSYLVFDHYQDQEGPKNCDFGSVVSCSDLLNSPYAFLFGVPMAHLGLLWSIFLLILTARTISSSNNVETAIERHKKTDENTTPTVNENEIELNSYNYQILFYWLLAGMAFVVYLIGVEILKRKICPICTIVHIATTVAFVRVRSAIVKRKISVLSLSTLKKRVLFDIVLWLFVAAIIAAFVVVPRMEQQRQKVNDVVALTADEIDCIVNARVRMFGSASCAVCRLQLTYFQFRNDEQKERFYIDCGIEANRVACDQMKLTALPTFAKFDEIGRPIGERLQSLTFTKKIKAFANC